MTLGFNSQLTYFQEIEQLALSGCRVWLQQTVALPVPQHHPQPSFWLAKVTANRRHLLCEQKSSYKG